VTTFDVLDLTDGRVVDLGTHLSGGWGPTQLLELPAGAARTFGDDETETCLYLVDGTARISLDGARREVAGGTGITLLKGTTTVLTARDDVRLFVATLRT
jgi:glyoxylate utilization-related uncharacterized protein